MNWRLKLAALTLIAAGIACRDQRQLPRAHEWALAPSDDLKAGRCDRALQALQNVPTTERDVVWWSMFENATTLCLYRDKNESYRTTFLKVFSEAEPSKKEDPSFLLWYGIGLEHLNQRADAEAKYAAAGRAARQVLATSSDHEARYEAQVVIDNLTQNRKLPAH